MTRYKCVNGEIIPLTPEEEAQRDREEAEWARGKEDRDCKAIIAKRIREYGDIGYQLDLIFHEGLEGWRAHIADVKARNPKPTSGN